ncbi:MAG: MFS transporter [Candidatus Xenobiia bacterium LiM19]
MGRYSITEELGSRVIRKVTRRLIPFMFLLYVVAYIDRINVGFAALQMNADLGFNDTVFGLGAGIFFLGYFLFQVPANLILQKLGARQWISIIMIVWGVTAAGMALVKTPQSFYLLRFLLGVAEAGFFPGMILYLTMWFPLCERAGATALFMTATAIAGVISGPVSGALLTMHGMAGISGWQWLFLLEGIPAVLLGIFTCQYLTDKPGEAKWLTEEERTWLIERIENAEENDRSEVCPKVQTPLMQILTDGKVWSFSTLYLSLMIGMYGISIWLPQIIRFFSHYHNLLVGLISVIPYLLAVAGMVVIGRYSDRSGNHRTIVAILLCAAGVSLLLLGYIKTPLIAISLLSLGAMGIFGALGPFWALSTIYLRKENSAGGIAMINSTGNLGGFIGPYIVGLIKDSTGDFTGSLLFLGLALLTGSLLAFFMRTVP